MPVIIKRVTWAFRMALSHTTYILIFLRTDTVSPKQKVYIFHRETENNMRKRGQIAIFIVAGIAILLLISVLLLFAKNSVPQFYGEDPESVRLYVNQCLEMTTLNAINRVAQTGGYIEAPPESIHLVNSVTGVESDIAYYYFFGEKISPEYAIAEIDKYIEAQMKYCINDFYPFRKLGKSISYESMEAKTTIGDKNVIANLRFPVTLEYNGQQVKLEKFKASEPIKLGRFYGTASAVVNELEEKGNVDAYISPADGEFVIMPFDSSRTVYAFRDGTQDLIFLFAVAK